MSDTNERSVGSDGSVLYAIVEYLRSLAGVRLNERERKLVILLDDAKHEIARMRLTDAEVEALKIAWQLSCSRATPLWGEEKTFRSMLERLG